MGCSYFCAFIFANVGMYSIPMLKVDRHDEKKRKRKMKKKNAKNQKQTEACQRQTRWQQRNDRKDCRRVEMKDDDDVKNERRGKVEI